MNKKAMHREPAMGFRAITLAEVRKTSDYLVAHRSGVVASPRSFPV
jgi:hypothetical protein